MQVAGPRFVPYRLAIPIWGVIPMASYKNPLDHVRIASPCSADWESMLGDDRRRFCGQCELNVYNLSGMTKREAEDLVNRAEGRLCVRFYRRSDGTILTKDCPVGLRAIKRRISRVRNAVVSSVLSFFAGFGVFAVTRQDQPNVLMGTVPVREREFPLNEKDFPVIMGDLEALPQPEAGGIGFSPTEQRTYVPGRKSKGK
jgi:hypothetical protein